jgi:hypothetical protein
MIDLLPQVGLGLLLIVLGVGWLITSRLIIKYFWERLGCALPSGLILIVGAVLIVSGLGFVWRAIT